MPRIRIIHPTTQKALNASLQWVTVSDADVSQLFRFEQVADPVAAPAPAPVPAPAPAPVPAPVPAPSPAPNVAPKTNVVPLGQMITTLTDPQPTQALGIYRVANNAWNAEGVSGQQSVGMQQGSVGVDFRAKWVFPGVPGKEVLSFPEVMTGRTASFPPLAGAPLPKRLSDLKTLVTSAQKIEGSASGLGHVVYDLWTTKDPNSMSVGNRGAEIMEAVHPIGGYGVPNWPVETTVGRAGQLATGRNPAGYKGRHTIGGQQFDVYFAAPDATNKLKWRFLVFVPVVFPGYGAHRIDWMPRLKFAMDKGFLLPTEYLANVELGVEPVSEGKPTSGDITVRGFQVSVS